MSLPFGSVFLAAGGLAMTVQVLLLRELMTALQGDEISISLGLAAWLAGIAAGAWLTKRSRQVRPEALSGFSIALLALAGPAGVAALRLLPGIVAPPAGELFGVGDSVLMAVTVLTPAGALVGAAFTSLAAAAGNAGWEAGRAITVLYVLEAVGALAAGVVLTWVLIPHLPPLQGSAAAGFAWLLIGWPASLAGPLRGRLTCPLLAAGLVVLASPPAAGFLERFTVEARHRSVAPGIDLLHWEDTPYTHVTIGGGEVRHLYESGRYVASFPDPSQYESEAHTIATLAPVPGRILLFGDAAAGLVGPLLLHPVESVDLVTVDPGPLDAVREQIGREDLVFPDDPRVRIVHEDPRRFLRRAGGGYGLIVVREPEPATLLTARLTTVEFYRSCSAALAEEGVLVVGVRVGPNVVRGESATLAASIFHALREVFPVVRAGPGPEGLLVAGFDPGAVTLDPGILAARFGDRGIGSEVFVPELFPILFPPDRVAYQEEALAELAETVPAGRDGRPVSFLHALALRQRIDGAFPAPLLGRAARIPAIYLCIFALLPSLAVLLRIRYAPDPERGVRRAASHAIAVTGACAIGWSLLLLFSYQTRDGALYGRIGLLAALFMFGLAMGAVALSSAATASCGRNGRRLQATCFLVVLFGFALAGLLLQADRWLGVAPLPIHSILMTAAGFVTGAVFPAATGALLSTGVGLQEAAGRLEGADHAGAACAALAAGVLFVPALGTAACAMLLVILESLALQGLLIAFRRRAVSSRG